MHSLGFDRYYTLEEAVARLPEARQWLEAAREEIGTLQDAVILFKRILLTKQKEGERITDAELATLQTKVEQVETAISKWVYHFAGQGIILRDIASGLIDFPYHARSTGQDYLLCWRHPEEGIFYFHTLQEGFAGRKPITLLPE